MSDLGTRLLVILCAGSAALAQKMPDRKAKAAVLVRVTTALVDADGEVHPIEPVSTGDFLLEFHRRHGVGGYYNSVHLGPHGDTRLDFHVEIQPRAHGAHHLKLVRTLWKAGKEEPLPTMEHDLGPFGSWTVTLLQDAGQGQRLVLQAQPWIEKATNDIPFDGKGFLMYVRRGVLVQIGDPGTVIFDGLYTWGAGWDFGIRGVGQVKLAPRPFPEAKPCGWVRGHVASFTLGGREYRIWSDVLILPEDPERPGSGWILYGTLCPDPSETGYYGNIPNEDLP